MELASLETGTATIAFATSRDERHPPECMIDGKNGTFWCSTGMYPQEFVLSFGSLVDIEHIRLVSCNIAQISIEKSGQTQPTNFEPFTEKLVETTEDVLQREEFSLHGKAISAQHLRFIINAGFEHFVAVYKLSVTGRAVK